MLVEFSIPRVDPDKNFLTAFSVLKTIKTELEAWSKKHNIPVTQKTVKHTHRVCFADDKHYTLFAMTWNPKQNNDWLNYTLVVDRNNRQ